MTMQKIIEITSEIKAIDSILKMQIDDLDLSDYYECILDFSKCRFGEPLPMLYLAEKIINLKKRYPHVHYDFRVDPLGPFRGYASHVGYFRYIGFNMGRNPGDALGSYTHIPIETFDISALWARADGRPYGELVDEEAKRLTHVLTQNNDGDLFDVIQYAIREMFRNSVEHSQGSKVTIFGQHWPSKNLAEIIILDDGVGIFETLLDHEYIEFANDLEAIKCSLLPGISGVSRSDRAKQNDRWGNSGFGLYVTSRICAKHGRFRIVSGDACLSLTKRKQAAQLWPFDGTCIQIQLSTEHIRQAPSEIRSIVEQGEVSRAHLIEQIPIRASVASKMLASDFRRQEE